jgi:hypothetical protein
MNELEERSILARFKSLYRDFPEGIESQPDKPDFIIAGEIKIGIELTQIFKDQHLSGGSLFKKKETFHIHLLQNAVDLLSKAGFPCCTIAIHLNDEVFENNLSARSIANSCSAEIMKFQSLIKPDIDFEVENDGNLPEVIEAFSISTYGNLKEVNFVQTGSATGEPLTNNFIQHILNKKERAKQKFIACDRYWLVIKEGDGEGDYFGELDINKNDFHTTFNKLFLLRRRNNELVEII